MSSSDGIMWYAVGMMLGIAIGSSSLKEEISSNLLEETKDAARNGAVTLEQNCRALTDLQTTLNEVYNDRARDEAPPSAFSFSYEDCLGTVVSQTAARPAPAP